jgi:trk system potassium uptake protein TrkH
MPRGILFWRSLTHWMGGMGIIVLYVAFLPAFGQNSVQMFQAEASGLTIEKVAPRLRENAKNLWLIYLLFSLSGVIAFFAGGMSLFDSFCHTFGAIATGGFSTKNTNMMAFGAYHQWVAIVLMFMGGINFIVHYRAFTGKPLYYFKDEEFHWYSSIIILFTLFFSLFLFKEKLSVSPIRDSLFQVVSILTTTGYNSVDFDLWPNALRFGLLILIFIGGCAGSTSGGLKVVRFLIGVKAVYQTVIQAMFPNAIVKTRLNTISLPDKVIVAIGAYFVLTVIMIFFGVQLLTLFDGCDIVTGLSATMASISAVGPGLNQVGPVLNYGWFSNPSKWVLIFLMLAGRLEFYSLLILFVPAILKK